MSVTAEQVEDWFREHELRFFRSEAGDAWCLGFGEFYIYCGLVEDGQFLWFRGSVLASLAGRSKKKRRKIIEHYLALNHRLKIGRFCYGDEVVYFEAGLAVESGLVTSDQFHRYLAATISATRDERWGIRPRLPEAAAHPEHDPDSDEARDEDSSQDNGSLDDGPSFEEIMKRLGIEPTDPEAPGSEPRGESRQPGGEPPPDGGGPG